VNKLALCCDFISFHPFGCSLLGLRRAIVPAIRIG